MMQKRVGETTITVPVPNHKEIKIGTLQSIIRQSKLSRESFEV
jgi:predicted RNA binding protein YcfA (HicA-like mRNA interferase family)